MTFTTTTEDHMSSIYTWERITCDDVKVGDKIARVRSHAPEEIVAIDEGKASRRLYTSLSERTTVRGGQSSIKGQNIRPRRDAKLWRVEHEEAGLEAEDVPSEPVEEAVAASPEPVEAQPISSTVIAALENAWAAIQARHPEVPPVVLITGTGAGRRRNFLVYGHYQRDAWEHADGKLPEVMITGERMADGAEKVLSTLLHEAAHALAVVRKIQDTSRQNRYHNKRFKALAEELGLSVTQDAKIGWSPTELEDSTAEDYDEVLGELSRALTLHRPHGPVAGVTEPKAGRQGPPPCVCGCGRKIRVAPSVLEKAPILCGECGEEFGPEED